MSHVGVFCLFNWVIVAINDAIQIFGNCLGYIEQFFMIELTVFYKHCKCYGGEVTNGNFIF